MATTKKAAYQYQPVTDRTPNQMTMEERACFLAHEIQEDVLADEQELAEAILTELQRFAFRRDVLHQIRADFQRVLTEGGDCEATIKKWAEHLDRY